MLELFYHMHTAQPDEFDTVFTIFKACWQESIIQRHGPWDEEIQHQFYREDFERSGMDLIMNGNEAIGLIRVEDKPETLYIAQFCILPEMRGRGLGSAIIGDLKKKAEENGKSLTLQTQKYNTRAHTLYARHGFVADGESETHIKLKLKF